MWSQHLGRGVLAGWAQEPGFTGCGDVSKLPPPPEATKTQNMGTLKPHQEGED